MATSPEPLSILDKHLSDLTVDAFMTLSMSLTGTDGGIGGRSWEGVAGKLGLNAGQVASLKSHNESNKGWLLLNTWGNLETGATVRKLIIALESLKMRGCIYTLQEAASISGDDIESAINQCAELIDTGKFYSLFSSYADIQFSKALYPHLHNRDQTHCLQQPPLPQPPVHVPVHLGFNESSIQEELPQTSEDVPAEPEKPRLEPKSVFFSYCPEYGEAGLKLHNKLRDLALTLNEYGYTIYYDKCCEDGVRKCGGVDLWKEVHIRKSENILVICTPEYFRDDEMALMEHRDSKIGVDRKLLRSIAYSSNQGRLMPVLLDEYKNVRSCIPSFVQAFQLHFWPSKKQDLLFYLAGKSKYLLPEVREKKVVEPIVIQIPPQPRVVQQRIQPQPLPLMQERKVVKPRVIEVPRTKELPKTQSKSSKSHDKKGRKLFNNPFSRTNNGKKSQK